jgi:hypothetical protein
MIAIWVLAGNLKPSAGAPSPVANPTKFSDQPSAVNLRQEPGLAKDLSDLQRFPTIFLRVVGGVDDDAVTVKLRVILPGCVMGEDGGGDVAGGAVVIGAVAADTSHGETLHRLKGFPDSNVMRGTDSAVACHTGHD